jgi:hypothetical protein
MTPTQWRLVIAGLGIGLAAGLAYAWWVNPVQFIDVAPARLGQPGRQEYIALVAEAYLNDGDLARAQDRLAGLEAGDLVQLVSREADAAYLRGDALTRVHAITVLAQALGGKPASIDLFSGTQTAQPQAGDGTPTATFEAIMTPTPRPALPSPSPTVMRPTRTPTPELIPAHTRMNLISLNQKCRDTFPGHIEVYVFTSDSVGIPGVHIEVDWAGEKATFVTGMKPEVSTGYADFEMVENRTYTVTLIGLSQPVVGLQSRPCRSDSGQTVLPSFELVFQPGGN